MSSPAREENVREITPERVRHVALLSRLELTEEEVNRFAHELTDVLPHLNKLGELDLEGVPPTSHAIPTSNVFREDVLRESLSNEEALANAPEQEDNCFKVPQII